MVAVQDPAFLDEALEVMGGDKPTQAQLWVAINKGAKRQWYHWHVMCEGLPLHSERSMHPQSKLKRKKNDSRVVLGIVVVYCRDCH